ncbi:MAG: DNA polymerase III subunit gamma/tau [Muribaculaceae bacterium]
MSKYIVSARKYRPETFRSVVGQQALTHTLKAAIDSQRLAHAYIFCGPRGVGKTTCARIFAKTINCLSPTAEGEACNECESCRAFNEQRSYNIVELDAASNNSVDDIRNLIDQVQIPPQIGRYRVFIIDEVHMLSSAAFNAFLKTLEEPPAHAIFILATTEKQKIIPTILSRCQIYDFSRITINDMVQQLQYIASQEGITAEPAALNVIAQKADGAMRDALSIFDQVAASSFGNITYQSAIDNLNVLDHDYYFRLMETFRTCNVPEALLIYKEIRDRGFDSLFFINGLAQHIRDMLVALTPQTKSLLEMSDEVAQRFIEESRKFHPKFYYRALDLCNTCDVNYRTATNKQFVVELTLIKLCQILDATTPPSGGNGGGQPLKSVAAAPQQTQANSPATATGSQPRATAQPAASAAPQPMVSPRTAPVSQPQPAATAPQMPSVPVSPTQQPTVPPAGYRVATGNSVAVKPGTLRTPAASRIMINVQQPVQQPGTAQGTATSPTKRRNSPFTEQQMLAAWQRFITEHPHEKVIINTMRMSQPKRVNDTLYEIFVENQGQVEFFNTHRTEIIEYLRNAVSNDMLAINVNIRQGGPAPKIWSPREVVDDMCKQNDAVVTLIRDFELGLA